MKSSQTVAGLEQGPCHCPLTASHPWTGSASSSSCCCHLPGACHGAAHALRKMTRKWLGAGRPSAAAAAVASPWTVICGCPHGGGQGCESGGGQSEISSDGGRTMRHGSRACGPGSGASWSPRERPESAGQAAHQPRMRRPPWPLRRCACAPAVTSCGWVGQWGQRQRGRVSAGGSAPVAGSGSCDGGPGLPSVRPRQGAQGLAPPGPPAGRPRHQTQRAETRSRPPQGPGEPAVGAGAGPQGWLGLQEEDGQHGCWPGRVRVPSWAPPPAGQSHPPQSLSPQVEAGEAEGQLHWLSPPPQRPCLPDRSPPQSPPQRHACEWLRQPA